MLVDCDFLVPVLINLKFWLYWCVR